MNPLALALAGRREDNAAHGGQVAHISAEEADLLRRRGGSGTINPVTGLPEYLTVGVAPGGLGMGFGVGPAAATSGSSGSSGPGPMGLSTLAVAQGLAALAAQGAIGTSSSSGSTSNTGPPQAIQPQFNVPIHSLQYGDTTPGEGPTISYAPPIKVMVEDLPPPENLSDTSRWYYTETADKPVIDIPDKPEGHFFDTSDSYSPFQKTDPRVLYEQNPDYQTAEKGPLGVDFGSKETNATLNALTDIFGHFTSLDRPITNPVVTNLIADFAPFYGRWSKNAPPLLPYGGHSGTFGNPLQRQIQHYGALPETISWGGYSSPVSALVREEEQGPPAIPLPPPPAIPSPPSPVDPVFDLTPSLSLSANPNNAFSPAIADIRRVFLESLL